MSEICDPIWLSIAQAAESVATTLGIVAAGVWAYYRFGLGRESETALGIELTHSTTSYERGEYLVQLDVAFANRGKVRLVAKPDRNPAYPEDADRLAYSGDLLLRRVPTDLVHGTQVRWWSEQVTRSPLADDIEADLLAEYELDGVTDFWLEPGETQHASVSIVLKAGSYLVMITFVGALMDKEFWRRSFIVNVPGPGPTSSLNLEAGKQE